MMQANSNLQLIKKMNLPQPPHEVFAHNRHPLVTISFQ